MTCITDGALAVQNAVGFIFQKVDHVALPQMSCLAAVTGCEIDLSWRGNRHSALERVLELETDCSTLLNVKKKWERNLAQPGRD